MNANIIYSPITQWCFDGVKNFLEIVLVLSKLKLLNPNVNTVVPFSYATPSYAIFAAMLFWIGPKKIELSYFPLFPPLLGVVHKLCLQILPIFDHLPTSDLYIWTTNYPSVNIDMW